jgi:hypothetical protein
VGYGIGVVIGFGMLRRNGNRPVVFVVIVSRTVLEGESFGNEVICVFVKLVINGLGLVVSVLGVLRYFGDDFGEDVGFKLPNTANGVAVLGDVGKTITGVGTRHLVVEKYGFGLMAQMRCPLLVTVIGEGCITIVRHVVRISPYPVAGTFEYSIEFIVIGERERVVVTNIDLPGHCKVVVVGLSERVEESNRILGGNIRAVFCSSNFPTPGPTKPSPHSSITLLLARLNILFAPFSSSRSSFLLVA